MPKRKPFKRICRPFMDDKYVSSLTNSYMLDQNYALDRVSLVRAFHLILADLVNIFDYIEPEEKNINTFSHRIYELFLRASTEFETNCKAILKANNYKKKEGLKNFDFFNINKASKLNEYSVKLNIWNPLPKELNPFKAWNNEQYQALSWYQDYNTVKHNRNINFNKASINNLLNAISAVFVVLYSQFNLFAFLPNQLPYVTQTDDDGFIFSGNSIFSIKEPTSWKTEEKYEFNWDKLKDTQNPFNNYKFE